MVAGIRCVEGIRDGVIVLGAEEPGRLLGFHHAVSHSVICRDGIWLGMALSTGGKAHSLTTRPDSRDSETIPSSEIQFVNFTAICFTALTSSEGNSMVPHGS